MVENLSSVDRADVYKGERLAGSLVREGGDVVFRYDTAYLQDPGAPQVAWTIPTSSTEVRASGGAASRRSSRGGSSRKESGCGGARWQPPRRPRTITSQS